MPQEKSLNFLLDQLDSRLGKFEASTGSQAEAILQNFDEVYDRFDELKDQEERLSVERDQFEYLQSRLRKNAPRALHELGGIAGLHSLRADCHPEKARWWWYLDEEVSSQRNKSLKGTALVLTIAIVVIAVLAMIYQFFLAPDPAIAAAEQSRNSALLYANDGNVIKALDSVDTALSNQPNDPELMVLKAMLLQKLGQEPQQVNDLNAQAAKLLGGQDKFLLTRSMLNLQLSDFQAALSDAQAAIQVNPDSAAAHYYAATAYQNLGNGMEAVNEYNIAYDLATKQGQSELAATIKIASAMMQQSAPDLYGASNMATATP